MIKIQTVINQNPFWPVLDNNDIPLSTKRRAFLQKQTADQDDGIKIIIDKQALLENPGRGLIWAQHENHLTKSHCLLYLKLLYVKS